MIRVSDAGTSISATTGREVSIAVDWLDWDKDPVMVATVLVLETDDARPDTETLVRIDFVVLPSAAKLVPADWTKVNAVEVEGTMTASLRSYAR